MKRHTEKKAHTKARVKREIHSKLDAGEKRRMKKNQPTDKNQTIGAYVTRSKEPKTTEMSMKDLN